MVRPSRRSEIAKSYAARNNISTRAVCKAFGVSETCYRYQAKLSDENALIADWLLRLTHNQCNWGFGLCFLFLRNVKGFNWNHKRVYGIYRQLELNLRIKPKKRIVREKPQPLAVPDAVTHFTQPGNPQQNAYIERFNRTVRYDWLSQHRYSDTGHVQHDSTNWLWSYNHQRPNMALDGITPIMKLQQAA